MCNEKEMKTFIFKDSIIDYLDDYFACGEHETCEFCKCFQNERFACRLLTYYRDRLIDKIYDIS